METKTETLLLMKNVYALRMIIIKEIILAVIDATRLLGKKLEKKIQA